MIRLSQASSFAQAKLKRAAVATLCGLTLSVAALSLAGCEGGPEPGKEGEYWGKKAADEKASLDDREAAIDHLAQVDDKGALPYLYEVLKGDKVTLKPKVPPIIAKLGDASSVDALVAGIDWKAGMGTDKKARAAATTNERIAKALAKVAPRGDSKSTDALKRLAESNHVNTQLAAVVALGAIGATGAVQDLIDIADGHTNNFMVKNAIISLGDIGDEKAVPVLVKLLFFERTGVSFYRESSYALFQVGKAAIKPLIQVYNNKYDPIEELHVEPGVQKAKALQVLSDIGGGKEVEALCVEAAGIPPNDTANTLARTFGAQCVGRLGLEQAKPALMKSWDEIDQSIAEHSLYALSQLGAKELAPRLLEITQFDGFVKQCMALDTRNKQQLCEEASSQVRPPRVTTLARIAPGTMLKDFDAMLKQGEEWLGKIEKSSIKGFQEKLNKKIAEGRDMVQAAADCDGKGEACWIEKLKNDNARQRERAGYEMLFLGDKRSEAGTAALLEAIKDTDNEARYAAILALWRTLPPKEAADGMAKQLESEAGKTQFVRINEDLKRLEIKTRRGY